MKIEADTDKILDLMRKRGIKNKRQLADNCGIDFRLIYLMFARRMFLIINCVEIVNKTEKAKRKRTVTFYF